MLPDIEDDREPAPADAARPRLGAGDCERLRDGWIAQPVNTATSLGYVVAGAVLMTRAGSTERGVVRGTAGLLALVGLGSVAYHGPQPPGARAMHDLPIAGLLAVLALTPLLNRRRGEPMLPGWSRRRAGVLLGVGGAALAAYRAGETGSCACDPDSLLQPHGAWHLLSAAGFVAVGDLLHRPVRTARP